MRICTCCRNSLEEAKFYKRKTGYSSNCKICTCEKNKQKRLGKRVLTENEELFSAGQRRCSCCEEVKSLDNFYKKRKSYEGFCKDCKKIKFDSRMADPSIKLKRALQQKEYIQRPEVAPLKVQYRKEYFQRNKEKHGQWVKDWNKKHPERRRVFYRTWQQKRPDIVRMHSNRRRVMKLRATPEWALENEWEKFYISEIYNLAVLRQNLFKVSQHVDHIVPLKSDFVCGLHLSSNLRVIPGKDNLSKGNKYWPDMWEQEHGEINGN